MIVLVKLLGTLSSCFRGHYQTDGIKIDMPKGCTVAELVDAIGIPRDKVSMVTINGFLARSDDQIPENAVVKFIQSVAGG